METLLLKVYGRVQGVGFRPFIYKLAKELDLKGYVLNTSSCVEIALQGEKNSIEKFIQNIKEKAPPLSKIEKIEITLIFDDKYEDFIIKESKEDEGFNFIPPDIAICEDCLKELFDPKDRRYKYPFINCTNCGPRYTIIEDLPYDREKTTMKVFKMCEDCFREYKDPMTRRFHAQPNACFRCGPEIWIENLDDKKIIKENIFKEISDYLQNGNIVLIKGVGGFHIAVDATNDEAVLLLRKRKRRESKPFALMMKDIDMIKNYCYVSEKEKKILTSKERPIVLLKIKDLKDISKYVAPNLNYLGVMLPYAPYHYLIFEEFKKPIILTSGNSSDEPIVKDNDEAKDKLSKISKIFVMHNREIKHRVDDSVVFVEKESFSFIRRGRGYAPDPIKIPISLKPSLSLGGELKNTFSLGYKNYVFMSPHIGDLKDRDTLQVFEETIFEYTKLFKISPEILIMDLHPQYLSTEFGEKFKNYVELKYLQHHKAHAFSLMLDREILDGGIFFSFDGTGYGEDEKIWGGEVFVGDIFDLKRVSHFKYFDILKSDYSIENPKRILYLYLKKNFEDKLNLVYNKFTSFEIEILDKIANLKENLIKTSSCGRIFDMVSSLIGVKDEVSYEGEAAILLEMESMKSETSELYNFKFIEKENIEIDFDEMILNIIFDLKRHERSFIGRKFHNTIAKIIFELSKILREKYNLKKIGFSGGVFQNRLLINLIYDIFKDSDFEIYFHRRVPPNDGGISLGQITLGKE